MGSASPGFKITLAGFYYQGIGMGKKNFRELI
jgi:hypothetical protein